MIPVINVARVIYRSKHREPAILEFKGSKLANTWHYRILFMYLKYTGLSTIYFENSLKSKIIHQLFLVCSVFGFIFTLQILMGLAIPLQKQPHPWGDIFMRLQFAHVASGTVIASYLTLTRKTQFIECLRHAFNYRSQCKFKSDQCPVIRRYKFIHSFTLGTLVVFFQYSLVNVLFISPWSRFRPSRKLNPKYVIYPAWYPVDIMSSKIFIWCAAVYEFASITFAANLAAVLFFTYLNLTASAAIRFAELGCFMERMDTSDVISFEDEWRNGKTTEIGNEKSKQIIKDPHEMILRKSIIDYTTLTRHSKAIHRLFSYWGTALHLHAFLNISFTAFGAFYEYQSSRKTFESKAHILVSLSYVPLGTLGLFIPNYYATLLEEAHDNVGVSLWSSKWSAGSQKFKKLFFHFSAPLNLSLKMGERALFPMNVESFAATISRIYSCFTFLLQIYANKNSIIS